MERQHRKLLDTIVGSPGIFSLEDRILNAVVFCAGIVSLISLVGDSVQGLGIRSVSYSTFMTLAFGTIYFFGRRKSNYKKLLIPFCIVEITPPVFVWYFLGGISGSSLIFMLSFLFVLPMITKGVTRYTIFFGVILLVGFLLVYEILNPTAIHYYEDGITKIVDKYLSAVFVAISKLIVIILIVNTYKAQQDKIEALNDDLFQANEELQATNEELMTQGEIISNQNEELKQTLKDLKDTQANLIQSEKMASLGILTAGIAHEINNPLNFIMSGYYGLENYLNDKGQIDEKVAMILENIKIGVERSANIVKDLNQFSRDNDTYTEECNIHSIINSCLNILRNQLKERIDIKKVFSNETVLIRGNVGKLYQVFINLLSNSIQAIKDKGNISIETKKQNDTVIIKISDSGCGIQKEELSKITDPFFTTKDPGKGTGLGLSIVYTIIKKHKGSIDFHSEVNKGTTAILTLPVNSEDLN